MHFGSTRGSDVCGGPTRNVLHCKEGISSKPLSYTARVKLAGAGLTEFQPSVNFQTGSVLVLKVTSPTGMPTAGQ
jgi:hypothetical protein